jgi:hypothetical protein
MAERSYDGDPIDMTHTHLSEIDTDGDDVEYVTNAEGHGEMTTENVPMPGDDSDDPDGAEHAGGDDRDITEDDVREIRKRLLAGESAYEISRDYDNSDATIMRYAKGERSIDPGEPPALKHVGKRQNGEWVVAKDTGGKSEKRNIQNFTEEDITGKDVRELRQRLLNGETVGEIAEDYYRNASTLRKYARGERQVDPDQPPALGYDGSYPNGCWVTAEDGETLDGEQTQFTDEESAETATDGTELSQSIIARQRNGNTPQLSEDDVAQIRQRLLDGEAAVEVADDYDVVCKVVRNYVKGDKTVDPNEPPALVYDGSGGEGNWVVPEDEDWSGSTDTESDQTADTAATPTETQATPIAPETETDSEVSDDRAVPEGGLTVLAAFVAGWLLSRWLGGDD